MKKKIWLVLCMCLCLMMFAACGSKKEEDTYNGITKEQLMTTCQSTVDKLENMTDEQKMAYLSSGDEMTVNLVNRFAEARSDLGEYQGLGEFEVTKSGKTLTAAQTVNYETRPIIVTYVLDYNSMQVTDITVDAVYTTGEKMSKAGLNTIMCIATVFAVLVIISLVIYCFRFIHMAEEKHKNKKESQTVQTSDVAKAAPVEEVQDDLELVAVIAAAIAAATGTSTDGFVVRSIKRRK